MRRMIAVAVFVVFAVFLFAGKVHAGSFGDNKDGDGVTVKYYSAGSDITDIKEITIGIVGDFSLSQRAAFIFANLFEDCLGLAPAFIPKGVKFIGADIDGGLLTLNVSKELLSYGGGTAYERGLIYIIAENAKGLGGVTSLTLLIEGIPADMPEGTSVFEMELE